jgi:hypothetical protein
VRLFGERAAKLVRIDAQRFVALNDDEKRLLGKLALFQRVRVAFKVIDVV